MVGGWWAVGSRMVEPLARCTLYLEPRHAKTEGAEQFPFLEWDSLAFQILRSIRKKRKKNSAPIRRLPRSFENPKKKKKTTQGSSHLSLWSEEKFDDRRGRFILLRTIYIYIFFVLVSRDANWSSIIILTIDLRAKRYWGYERIYAYIFHQYRLIRSRTLHSRLDNCSSTYSI